MLSIVMGLYGFDNFRNIDIDGVNTISTFEFTKNNID